MVDLIVGLVEFARRAFERNTALLQAVQLSRGGDGAHDVLLDDDHRRSLGDHRRQALEDLGTTIGASPRLSSSHRRRRGFDISARPIATICCWPPESDVLLLVAALGKHRKQGEDAFEVPRTGSARSVRR